jgi:hypothetical protein
VTVLGARDSSTAYLQYRVASRSRQRRAVQLFLALRPFQVNPSWQFLNTPGGAATVRQLSFDNQTVQVNGETAVVSLTPATAFGAATFDQGNIVDYLRDGRVPATPNVRDTFGHASGALAYTATLDSGTSPSWKSRCHCTPHRFPVSIGNDCSARAPPGIARPTRGASGVMRSSG